VRERIRRGAGIIRKAGADYLAYAVLDAIIDYYFPIVEDLGERIEDIEDEVVRHPGRGTLAKIYAFKRELLHLRRAIWPQRESLSALARDDSDLVGKEARVYLRDCNDHAIQLIEVIESLRELAASLLDVYLSSVANRTNEVMKVLTVVSTIFIPLTFLVGVYGMNFNTQKPGNMPELDWPYGYVACWAFMISVAVALLVYFWRRGWLRSGEGLPRERKPRRPPRA
jgi:magnesium transporter